ncbi:winged helix-turn-helix domain-containing protein [Bowmanella denitrificans]|uniref:Winged helix-turn-helix domain-containing protein n=1 Tax=Bowmanella denitrificans TaxID=366582 RepID=A0ABN0WL69_9ALTE
MLQSAPFTIGEFKVEPLEYAIYLPDGEKHSLQPKFIEVLCYLASHYPRVVPRQELIEHVWQGNGYVGEKALTNAIWHLRQALKQQDGSESIQTIRKSGYQLLVQPEFEAEPAVVPAAADMTGKPRIPVWGWSGLGIILLIVGLFWWWPQEQIAAIQPDIITKQPGMELFPAPSPDGLFTAFKWRRSDGSMDLYLQDARQPNLPARQLTFDEANEGRPVWDMTGKFLFFRRKNDDLETCQVIRLEVESLQEKVVGKCPLGGDLHYLDISPDNSVLAYWGLEGVADTPAVYIKNLNDESQSAPTCLNECNMRDRDLAFSPDGSQLAISRRISRFAENIYLRNLATGEERQLTEGESDIVGISWHPDGKHLVYGVQRADARSGFLLNIHSGESTPMNIEGFSYPSFAKQVPWLYFQTRSEFYQIAYLPVAEELPSSPFPLLQSDYNHKYPDYSAATDRIAYLSNESGHYEIWVADAEGNQRQQLTHLKRSVLYPRWSHDGRRIAFLAANANGKGDSLMIVDVDTKRLIQVPSPFPTHQRPTWTADDQALVASVYDEEQRQLYLFPLDNRPVSQLTEDGGVFGIMLADGTLIYSRSEPGLYSMAAGSKQPKLLIAPDHFGTRYTWTLADSGNIYFADPGARHTDIKRFDAENGTVAAIMRLPLSAVVAYSSLSLDSKRQRLLFNNTIKAQSDIKRIKDLPLN